jgi:hypothetical protein
MKPQTRAVLALLRERGSRGVTPLDALEVVGSFRLAARVSELRAAGYDVRCDRTSGFGRYELVENEQRRLWDNGPVGSSDQSNRIANGARVSATTRGAGVVPRIEVVAR